MPHSTKLSKRFLSSLLLSTLPPRFLFLSLFFCFYYKKAIEDGAATMIWIYDRHRDGTTVGRMDCYMAGALGAKEEMR
ncbi:Uncharacterized protein HZ326_13084 [Fusarium oxysporum f. sp. albedinis]|nr:Uncharacterized protein HZ326_13084 [Fusarium oxysporum f. sp. albedinis]